VRTRVTSCGTCADPQRGLIPLVVSSFGVLHRDFSPPSSPTSLPPPIRGETTGFSVCIVVGCWFEECFHPLGRLSWMVPPVPVALLDFNVWAITFHSVFLFVMYHLYDFEAIALSHARRVCLSCNI